MEDHSELKLGHLNYWLQKMDILCKYLAHVMIRTQYIEEKWSVLVTSSDTPKKNSDWPEQIHAIHFQELY